MTSTQKNCLIILLLISPSLYGYGLTNLTSNDPYPLFTSREPYNFLVNHAKWNILTHADLPQERFSFSASVFRQAADKSRNIDKERVPLFDKNGKWNMLALTYDPKTKFKSQAICEFVNTDPERQDLLPVFTEDEIGIITSSCIPLLTDPANTDTNEKLGFFSVPGTYRKNGVRFDGQMALWNDFGLTMDISFADIKAKACDFLLECPEAVTCITLNDAGTGTQTCTIFQTSCTCLKYVDLELMKKLETIADQLDLDIHEYQKTSIEDFRLGAYWRHLFVSDCDAGLAEGRNDFHPCCIFMPFVTIEGNVPFEDQIDNRKLFAIPFGNNGHGAVGMAMGFNIIYHTWVEFGSEVGFTHFFSRRYNHLPMPTQELQAGIFPFQVDACIQPGNNWHFGATLTTPYFLPHLSFYAQYLYINHSHDCVNIFNDNRKDIIIRENCLDPNSTPVVNPVDPATFLVDKYQRSTAWDVQLANVALNYEFCPEIIAGIAWQLPLRERNAYRSTTVLFSLTGIF